MSDIKFLEKQYLGLNKISLSIRISLSVFCFTAYYLSEYINNENKDMLFFQAGDLYFFLGIFILIVSVFLFFILHFKTKIENGSIILDGIWTAKKVKIDTRSIKKSEVVNYSKYIVNPSVYNLQDKGVIRFYTRGKYAVKLIDKDGLIYLIGSQNSKELNRIINKKINNQ